MGRDTNDGCVDLIAVAIDKDKNSQSAVKWAVDNLFINNPHPSITLIHVRIRNRRSAESLDSGTPQKHDLEAKQIFIPYRGYCARKGVQVKEVLLDDMDITEAIVAYINSNIITNIVVGASTRSILIKRFRNPDVPTCLTKFAPEFCSLYVISKGKPVTIRTACRPPPRRQQQQSHAPPAQRHSPSPSQDAIKIPTSTGRESCASTASTDRTPLPWDRTKDYMKTPPRDRSVASTTTSKSSTSSMSSCENQGHSSSMFTPRTSYSRDSNPEASNFSDPSGDMATQSGRTSATTNSQSDYSPSVEAEILRLRLELSQTLKKYSSTSKEAYSVEQKALEFQQWKMEEAIKFEQARQAEEANLALSRIEKIRFREAAQRIPELEAKKKEAEKKAQNEAAERNKVLNALERSNIRYRKYSIEDIKEATQNFSDSLRIGEGGYGPVFKGYLDHTEVAIKILRPDAAQGMKQFQQEVEVLSCIRHPNMVLLLGACPEYGCLVYEYMDNGSLDDRLSRKRNTPPIPWWTRFKIAAEIATGLLFLHQTKPEPLVHRDLKPANILLDQNYVSKISDVGLARLVPPSVADSVTQYHMTSAAGTFCYIDPEYQQTGMLGTKSDIYSLGILLLEIITAKSPMGLSHQVERSIERGTFADILDPTVTDWPVEETLSYAKLALRCAELRKKDRPDLSSEILPELNRLRNLRRTSAP